MAMNALRGGLRAVQGVGKALSDPGRLRILAALRGRELCVCHLCALLELDQSTVSRHMATLREGGLVVGRRAGRWTIYRRTDDVAAEPLRALLSSVDAMVSAAPEVREDARRLSQIVNASAVAPRIAG
jgi:ArsR family transcriptional regulator